jgi:hypothetical protein
VTERITLDGRNNYGQPRQNFADQLALFDDASFQKETEQCVWLSAFANNNLRSDYHWMADACYAEAKRRDKPELYRTAWERASGMSS